MTRMTPTNDAPVTVEQCDRDRAREYEDWLDNLSISQTRAYTRGDYDDRLPELFARHRLAAFASAPAGDGEEEDKIVLRAVEQVMRGFSFETLAGPENLRARLSLCARQAVHDTIAALARPRAAVGEQTIPLYTFEEAWDELVNVDDRTSPEEYPDMCLITRDELRTFMEARQYAPALQSPPAKV